MKRLVLLAFVLACGGKSAPTENPNPNPAPGGGDCVTTGCSGTVCAEAESDIMTTCEMKPEYACYRDAQCARQPDGACGWTETPELQACLDNPPPL
jgi:eight-cysteine-cluster-containing protein